MPDRKIIIGPVDAPILTFYNSEISEIREVNSVAMVGAELAIDQFVPVVRYELIIRYVLVPKNLDEYQSFTTADGYTLTGKYTYDIRAIPYGTPIRFYIDDRPSGLYYINKVDRLGRDSFKLNCISAVGMMDKQRHVGAVYTGERFDEVLAELIGEGYDYIIDSDVAELRVYGWLPYGTKRSNLHQLLVAFGVTIIKSDTGGMLFTFLKAVEGTEIPTDRIYNEGSVVYGETASRVEILEHGYYYLANVDDIVLFDTRGEVAENTVVVFKQPIYKDSITVQEGDTLTVLEAGTNYAIVSGVGILKGKPYVHTTRLLTADNPEAPTEKIVSVENATLITMANSENSLKRISEYYFHATTVKNSIAVTTEKTGKRYTFFNPFKEFTSAFLVNMSSYSSAVTKADCEFIQDYVPIAQGSSFMRREILELTEEGATWNIPESVHDKEVPQIRVALIGAGYDGESGKDGSTGSRGTSTAPGKGGDGGKGGAGGDGGKIFTTTIDCSNLAFLTYGKNGKDTWVQAGNDYLSSAQGYSSRTGFVEMFTGAVLALPGNSGTDGAPGGSGGSYPPIAASSSALTDAQPGGNVDFNGVTYKGGKPGNRVIINGGQVTAWLHENMRLYFGGSGGGGAAAGGNGGDGISAKLVNGVDHWDVGGYGADAAPVNSTTALYGSGGNGGNGGGGGGGNSNVHWWNEPYSTLIGITDSSNSGPGGEPGNGGKGSPGTEGYRGCLIIYY